MSGRALWEKSGGGGWPLFLAGERPVSPRGSVSY